MGVKIAELFEPKPIEISSLAGKVIAIDASNHLYQFLSTIRGPTGELLTDDHGNVTSHLIGLLARTSNLMKQKLKIIYVFDGKPPELKSAETKKRRKAKKQAEEKFEQAKKEEDIEGMKKYASRTSRLTPEMVEEAKKLLKYLGIPILQAPGEAEAQAAVICKNKDAYAVASQDADALLFGTPRLIRNLSITGRRKQSGKLAYNAVDPELIVLKDLISSLKISQEQFIALSMLVGTDYNIGGIPGLGPKKALELVKKHEKPSSIFSAADWNKHFTVSWKEVFSLFTHPKTTTNYNFVWNKPAPEKVIDFLCSSHGFSEERVESALKLIVGTKEQRKQTNLGDF